MYDNWLLVRECVTTLVWRLLEYDDDGMEMYFTNPPNKEPREVRPHKKQSVEEFETALDNAIPASRHGVDTNLEPLLDHHMNSYLLSLSKLSPTATKRKTIIVLTDGAWKGMGTEHRVDESVQNRLNALISDYTPTATKKMGQNASSDTIRKEAIRLLQDKANRPVTIQFIRIGHDSVGVGRLQRLDDNISEKQPYYPSVTKKNNSISLGAD